MISDTSIVKLLIAKLSNYGPLSTDEKLALEKAVSAHHEVPPDTDIVLEGTSPDHSTLLLSGFAARYNLKLDGKRQITSLHMAGDFVDLHSFLVKPMDHSIVSLSTCKLAIVTHDRLTRITERYPRLARLLWLNTLIDGGIHRRWSFCLGSLQAPEHLAHLVCELYVRLKQISRTDEDGFHIPLTQGLLAECLAVSPVHANRALQKLRSTKAMTWERDHITIKDWNGLVDMSEFDPTYLRMPKTQQL